MLRRLHEAETASGGTVRYTLLVCGDHSTPVMFGDHSHEPVPLAIAHVRHVLEVRMTHSSRLHVATEACDNAGCCAGC